MSIAQKIRNASVIFWDEVVMHYPWGSKAVDRAFSDLMSTTPLTSDKPFGGTLLCLGGDFRGILPIIAEVLE
ncbi:hypothetical protein BGZ67_001669, partial [Mortierella alpina]